MRTFRQPSLASLRRRTPVALLVASGIAAMLGAPAARAQDEKAAACKIIVLNLQGKNLPKADTEIPTLLTETLALEVATVSGCQVLSQQDIGSMLDLEAKKAECGDGSDSCLSEVGSALGADRVIGGAVGKIGSEFVITGRLLNVRTGEAEARAEEAVTGDAAQLRRAAKNVGRKLFNVAPLDKNAPIDDSPLVKNAGAPSGPSPLFIGGVAAAGVGVATAGIGGVLTALANQRLAASPNDEALRREGVVTLGVTIAGGVVALVGGALVVAAVVSTPPGA